MRILTSLGFPSQRSYKEHEAWERVQANLAAQGVAILVIDEMHNVLAGRNRDEREKIASTLKSLLVSDTNPIQLVLAGLDKLKTFIETWEEVERRSHFLELKPLQNIKDSATIISFLSELEKKIGMKTCGFTQGDMPQRFMAASDGLIGRMAFFVQEAASIAVSLDDDEVTHEYLAEAYKRPYPVSPRRNPFLVANIRDFGPPKRRSDEGGDTFLRGRKKSGVVDDDEIAR